MSVRQGQESEALLDAMRDRSAQEDGIRVALQADTMTFLTAPNGLPAWSQRYKESEKQRHKFLADLPGSFEEVGAEFN